MGVAHGLADASPGRGFVPDSVRRFANPREFVESPRLWRAATRASCLAVTDLAGSLHVVGERFAERLGVSLGEPDLGEGNDPSAHAGPAMSRWSDLDGSCGLDSARARLRPAAGLEHPSRHGASQVHAQTTRGPALSDRLDDCAPNVSSTSTRPGHRCFGENPASLLRPSSWLRPTCDSARSSSGLSAQGW